MTRGYQPSPFEQDEPPPKKPSPAARFDIEPPARHTSHEERLRELDMRYGATYVYRILGQLYSWGDFAHCPKEDIEHNIRKLTQMIQREPRFTYIGKPYTSEIYRSREKLNWAQLVSQVRETYGESMFTINSYGDITGESVRGEPLEG